MKTILLAPLDPVHDNAIKLLKRKLDEAGYNAISMPPGTTPEEVIQKSLTEKPEVILVSRTLGYKVAEILSQLLDLAEASGVRDTTRIGIGGMAITKEAGAELGFDGCFVGELKMNEVIDFIENRVPSVELTGKSNQLRIKPDITAGYTYKFYDPIIEELLERITSQTLAWVKDKTTIGIERAKIRTELLECEKEGNSHNQLLDKYISLCDPEIQNFYKYHTLPDGVRWLGQSEINRVSDLFNVPHPDFNSLRHTEKKPLFFSQYGTGCPIMDVYHIKVSEAWGIDGVFHFDPSWNAQKEGLLEGHLTHEYDGTILTLENLQFIHHFMEPYTLWNVRGHRGLNTPETQVLGHAAGADLFKINIPYGSTAGGTDPQRLTVDGIYSLMLAAQYGIPFDIPGNDELSGVPPYKTFAGILIMMALGLKLGARPIPKPLLCYSPYMTINGLMDDNMIDMNVAKLAVWRDIVDTPIWPGEPVGFMTHTSDRVQSALQTSLHASLAATMDVDAVTIASSDEAYSKGPISVQARVDTLRAVRDQLRFQGSIKTTLSPAAESIKDEIHEKITETLSIIADRDDFVASIYEGLIGSQEDGLYPGRIGAGTVNG
ncbi:MAG TPA: cobalamin-binding protein [Anaerolineaceae bacterium]|nr:cobalamin-binding protein [Anaerolineaceae bacterium]